MRQGVKYTIRIYFIALALRREDTQDQTLNSELEAKDCKGELKFYMK
jgi:hypothetical protein